MADKRLFYLKIKLDKEEWTFEVIWAWFSAFGYSHSQWENVDHRYLWFERINIYFVREWEPNLPT